MAWKEGIPRRTTGVKNGKGIVGAPVLKDYDQTTFAKPLRMVSIGTFAVGKKSLLLAFCEARQIARFVTISEDLQFLNDRPQTVLDFQIGLDKLRVEIAQNGSSGVKRKEKASRACKRLNVPLMIIAPI
jgi:hypothetical protein